jgi:hypothetical protein
VLNCQIAGVAISYRGNDGYRGKAEFMFLNNFIVMGFKKKKSLTILHGEIFPHIKTI